MLRINEIAEILGLSRAKAQQMARDEKWVRRWVNRGVGSCYLYDMTREDVEAIKLRMTKVSDEEIAMMQGEALSRLEAVFVRAVR